MKITQKQLTTLRLIKKRFFKNVRVPKRDNWKKDSNDKLWNRIVQQVLVVGGSASADRYSEDPEAMKLGAYSTLLGLKNRDSVRHNLRAALKLAGTRFQQRKTNALVRNFFVLKANPGGPKGFFQTVAMLDGSLSFKIAYMKDMGLEYVSGLKSARDMLMEAGILRDFIALDVRVRKVLSKLGIKIPESAVSNQRRYLQYEKEILEKICRPLNMEGIEFDRLIYQAKDEILEFLVR